jgi:hypothetical protein
MGTPTAPGNGAVGIPGYFPVVIDTFSIKICDKDLILCSILLVVSYHALFARARSIISTSAKPAGKP